MEVLPGGVTLILYAVVAVLGVPLLALLVASKRERRHAGFASKAQLRRQMSAKAVLRAAEIRPSLSSGASRRRPAVDLTKRRPRSRPH